MYICKKSVSILLSLIMIVSLFAIVPFTAGAASGTSIYTYTVNDGSATITGLKSATVIELNIPSEIDGYTVTGIDDNAFRKSYIQSVIIPDSVTSIGNRAFYLCSGLNSVTIGNGVRSIGDSAFALTSITSITIPDSVTSIGDSAFLLCSSLTGVIFEHPDTQQTLTIGEDAFAETSAILSYSVYRTTTLCNGNSEIPGGFNAGVLSGKTLTWKEIYSYKINNGSATISGLKVLVRDLDIPPEIGGYTVTSIGNSAFFNKDITSVTIPDSVTSIGARAFSSTDITSVTIPDSVTSLGDSAFHFCHSLESVTIGKDVRNIGQDTFCDTHISSIDIPFGVTTIGNSAFQYCNNLTSVTIPASVTSIGDSAFNDCRRLTSVIFDRPSAQQTLPIGDSAYVDVSGTLNYSGDSRYAMFDGDTEIERGTELATLSGKTLTWKEISYTPTYTVTWKNDNGSTIDTTEVEAGAVPTHSAAVKAPNENLGYIFSDWSPKVSPVTGDVTYTAQYNYVYYVAAVEPYIDENGDYKLGTKAYYKYNGKNYAVNADYSIGNVLNDLKLSYFDFSELSDGTYQILHYTGPKDSEYTINELVIPDTYQGKKVTVLGTGNVNDSIVKDAPVIINNLKLGKYLTEVKRHAFIQALLSKVTGDTPNLKTIGELAFCAPFGASGNSLDISLEYQGTIHNGGSIFDGYDVTLHLKHATKFSSSLGGATVTYVFTDTHTYGEPEWTWADDYSTATATFTCSDSRCNDEKTVNADVTLDVENGKLVYIAAVEFEGESYTGKATTDTAVYKTQAGNMINLEETFTRDEDDTAKLGIGDEFKNFEILGVQKKYTAVSSIDNEASEDRGVRFVAVLNNEILQDAEDYGFIVVAGNDMNDARANIADVTLDNASKNNVFTCKETSNSVSGDYGKYDSDKGYKYVTFSINNIRDKGVAVMFYLKDKNDNVYYAPYTNGKGETFTNCAADWLALTSNSNS